MMKNKPEKGSVAMGIAGIGAAIFGIIWTIEANSMTRNSSFGNGPSIIMTAGGILFVVSAVVSAVRGFRNGSEEEQMPGDNHGDGETGEKTAAGTFRAVKESQPAREKGKWSCPYCGTAVDGDERFCPGCGAGRK